MVTGPSGVTGTSVQWRAEEVNRIDSGVVTIPCQRLEAFRVLGRARRLVCVMSSHVQVNTDSKHAPIVLVKYWNWVAHWNAKRLLEIGKNLRRCYLWGNFKFQTSSFKRLMDIPEIRINWSFRWNHWLFRVDMCSKPEFCSKVDQKGKTSSENL